MVSTTSIDPVCLDNGKHNAHHSSRKPLILVIEDDSDNSLLLYHFLTLNQFDVLMASDVLTGLELATANSPDLVLLDIMLPKMSGYDFIRRIRKNLELTHIPIIAVTGMATEKDQQRMMQAGCSDYICKPYLLDSLLETVQRQLDKLMPLEMGF